MTVHIFFSLSRTQVQVSGIQPVMSVTKSDSRLAKVNAVRKITEVMTTSRVHVARAMDDETESLYDLRRAYCMYRCIDDYDAEIQFMFTKLARKAIVLSEIYGEGSAQGQPSRRIYRELIMALSIEDFVCLGW